MVLLALQPRMVVRSVVQFVGRFGQLPFRFLTYRAVVFSDSWPRSWQADQIAGIVFEVLVTHRVPKKMRVQLEAADREYLSHKARKPRSVSGPRSPTKTRLD